MNANNTINETSMRGTYKKFINSIKNTSKSNLEINPYKLFIIDILAESFKNTNFVIAKKLCYKWAEEFEFDIISMMYNIISNEKYNNLQIKYDILLISCYMVENFNDDKLFVLVIGIDNIAQIINYTDEKHERVLTIILNQFSLQWKNIGLILITLNADIDFKEKGWDDKIKFKILFLCCYAYIVLDIKKYLTNILEIDGIDKIINYITQSGDTLLFIIIKYYTNKIEEIIKMLIYKNLDINYSNKSLTLLHIAIKKYNNKINNDKYFNIIKYILEKDILPKFIFSSIQLLYELNIKEGRLFDLLHKTAKEKYERQYDIYTKIHSIIRNLIETKRSYTIEAHGKTIKGQIKIPDNICICVPIKTGECTNIINDVQLSTIKRIYFPGYKINNLYLDFKLTFEDRKKYSYSGVIPFDPSKYLNSIVLMNYTKKSKISKFLSDKSICPEFIIQKNTV